MPPGQPQRGFAMEGLSVQASFPGEYQVRLGQSLLQTCICQYQINARQQAPLQKTAECRPHAAGGASTWEGDQATVQLPLQQPAKAAQLIFKNRHLGFRGTLLRGEYRCGPLRPAERVVNVTGHHKDCIPGQLPEG